MKKSPLFTIFLVVFFDLLSFGIVIPILPYYSKSFGANAFQLGWLMATYSIAQFAFAPIWGSLSDRVGRRPVLLATILFGASAMVATALAGSLSVLLLARLFAGAFAANISTASAYIADITSEENRAKGMGVIGAGFGLGFIFGPAVGGLLAAQHNYSLPILCAAGLGFLNFLFAFVVLAEPERVKAPASRSRFAGAAEILSNPRAALPITLFFLHTLAFTQLEVSFGLFVLERFGFGHRTALNFPNETRGILDDSKKWQGTENVTVTYGYHYQASSLQFTAAVNAIANGGVYVEPKMLKATIGADGKVVDAPLSATHAVISPASAATMASMMKDVVCRGTGTMEIGRAHV